MVIGPQHIKWLVMVLFSDYLFDTIIFARYGQHLLPINFVTYLNLRING
jgi:hypothetical protein